MARSQFLLHHLNEWGTQIIANAMLFKAASKNKLTSKAEHLRLMNETAKEIALKLREESQAVTIVPSELRKEFAKTVYTWCAQHMAA